jgi:double-stranded uracil-DNA glycosylase
MDRATIATYESAADEWIGRGASPKFAEEAIKLAASCPSGVWRADLGCGPGWHAPTLGVGGPVLAIDAARAMARQVGNHAPGASVIVGDLEALPVRSGALGAGWARGSYQHVPAERLPLALADLHRALATDAPVRIFVTSDRLVAARGWVDPIGPRHFSHWAPSHLADVMIGAGFAVDAIDDDGAEWLTVRARRDSTLADIVGPGMRLLIVGLNPSVYSAERGIGFARPGNRFWPALLASGLVERDRDPLDAHRRFGIGFTDLVKRATPRADGLGRDEYVDGTGRVERLVAWLQPAAVCFAGLSGYRVAVDRRAQPGWQPNPFGGRPAYVMPNPSGLNAHTTVDDLARHLQSATTVAPEL